MCSRPLWLCFVLATVLSVGCSPGVSVLEPVVEGIEPNCGDRAAQTTVTVLGTLPVKTVASHEGSEATIDNTYHAWVGARELLEVKWVDGHTLTAVVPPGIEAGTYGLTLQSPFATRATKDALFEVRAGECHCTPKCVGKACGDDGCGVGGTCGTCPSGTQCSSAGTCDCIPNCAGKTCGDDGCGVGGTCGTCPSGTACSGAGTCGCAPTCGDRECGGDGCGGTCGTCQAGSVCDNGTCICTPNCSGRECGSDGCEGTCGTCEAGWSCSSSGACTPPTCTPPDSYAICSVDYYYCGLNSQGIGWCCPSTHPHHCDVAEPSCYSTAAAAAAICGGSCQECVP